MDKNEFYNSINDLIKENRKTYSDSPKRFISDFNREIESTNEYNGRQILELLQNADDADSHSVQICFEKEAKKLIISNKGEPFSVDGIESLMMANLSPKTKKRYIGNKGLGFRSILNWADKILIRSNECLLEFSPDKAKIEFDSIITSREDKINLLKGRGLSENAVPFPVLSIPGISLDTNPNTEWTTIIEIYYKTEFEEKIKLQLEDCTEEILLFLNNVEEISIVGLKEELIKFKRIKLNEEDLTLIQIKDKVWRIETKEDYLPEELQDKNKLEKEFYNITIAFQDELTDTYYKLFNYFPSKLSVYLPCIIHATFELNSSRDYLNESKKNEFIFEKLVDLLKECSSKLAKEKYDWRPFRIILPVKKETDSTLIGLFYSKLAGLYEELPVFPCTNSTYVELKSVRYYGKKFSEWAINNQITSHFPGLLCPEEKVVSDSFRIEFNNYSNSEFSAIIDGLNNVIISVNARAELISLMLDDAFSPNKGVKYSILINDNDKIINKSNVAFTPTIEADGALNKPDFVNLDFINRKLYEILTEKHKNRFESGEPEAREFQRLFKEIVNVQPYDSNNVISKIISGTRERIRSIEPVNALSDIKIMVQCLFENYKSLKYKTETFTETCPLINKQNEIKESHLLFLSSSYPSGILTEILYDGVLKNEYFIAEVSYYELNESNLAIVESFFIWLGVNKLVQFNEKKINKEQWEYAPYFDFVFSIIQKPHPVSRYSFKGREIGLFNETVAKLSDEKLILLVLKEEHILHSLELNNSDELWYQYANNFPTIPSKPSYISFQIDSLKRFENYLIESNNIPFINKVSVNYEDPIFKQYGIKGNQINDVLEKLGAQGSFIELKTEKVYELIKTCSDLEVENKLARKLYLQAFEHFRSLKGEIATSIFPGTKLLAVKNLEKEYQPFEEIYYSDNSTMPEKITKDLWIFDFPKRAGENQVSRFFGVKTFKHLRLNILRDDIIDHPQLNQFNKWFIKIKPLILAFRLSNLKTDLDKRDAANALKRCTIRLVTDIYYTIDDGNKLKLGYDEPLVTDDQFIICTESYKKIENFQGSPKFCGAFAEIMCILFKVNESKNNYISVFKDSVEFSKELIIADSLEEHLNEAYELLGLSQNESSFWEAICKIKGVSWPDFINDDQELSNFLIEHLEIDLPKEDRQIDFDNFSTIESISFLKNIIDSLGITLEKIKEHFKTFIGLKKWHYDRLTDISWEIEKIYANTLWESFSSGIKEKQKGFIDARNAFRNWFNNYDWNDTELPAYQIELDYFSILQGKANIQFDLELNKNNSPIVICPDYVEILAKHEEIEKSFNNEQRSLLFFDGNQDVILKIIESLIIHEVEKPIEVKKDLLILPIVETKFINKTSDTSNKRVKQKSGGGAVDPNKEKAKRKAGKNAELKVRDAFVNKYGRKNVQWVSGNSDEVHIDDSLGYDFLYRKKEDDEWYFMEVKSVSANSFIISENELNIAFKNKDKYHLALFKMDQINIDYDFFKNSDLENDYNKINSGNSIKPYDYEVYVELGTNDVVEMPLTEQSTNLVN